MSCHLSIFLTNLQTYVSEIQTPVPMCPMAAPPIPQTGVRRAPPSRPATRTCSPGPSLRAGAPNPVKGRGVSSSQQPAGSLPAVSSPPSPQNTPLPLFLEARGTHPSLGMPPRIAEDGPGGTPDVHVSLRVPRQRLRLHLRRCVMVGGGAPLSLPDGVGKVGEGGGSRHGRPSGWRRQMN